MVSWYKVFVAEFIGTFALVFIGAGSIIANSVTQGALGVTGIALAHGLTLAVMVSATASISGGHINPAVTVGFLVTRRIAWDRALLYIVAQLLGAAVAAVILRSFLPAGTVADAKLGATLLDPQISFTAGVVIELVLTFFLVFAVFGTAVDQRVPRGVGGFAIGLTLALSILMGGPWTGAALNPARAFGPALAGSYWGDHLVYWVGPLLGGVAAALLYHHVLLKDDRAQGK